MADAHLKIRQILDKYGVRYVSEGRNVAHGHIAVKCPFCERERDPDPSQHLGISLTTTAYGCWRNPAHRGRRLWWVVAALTGISYEQARRETGEFRATRSLRDNSRWEEQLALLQGTGEVGVIDNSALVSDWNKCFSLAGCRKEFAARYVCYMKSRGFKKPRRIAERFDLRFSTSGWWKQRIIAPLWDGGELVAMVGRTVRNDATRYFVSKPKDGGDIARMLLCEERIMRGGKVLFIAEGLFDAMKLAMLFPRDGYEVTCVFGLSISRKVSKLRYIASKFDSALLVLDKAQAHVGYKWEREELAGFVRSVNPDLFYPPNVSDPGEVRMEHLPYIEREVERVVSHEY